jgi:hypothetical protein
MRPVLVASSGVLALAATIPYLLDIVRGRTKPRLVSWLVWSVLLGIGSAAVFATRQLPAGVLSLCDALACGLVVLLGYKHGERIVGRLDVACLLGACLALGLWGLLKSPAIAAVVIVVTDFLGAIPTFRHSWLRPYEETWLAFALSGLSGAVTLLAANFAVLTAIVYPLYILVANFIIVILLLLVSPHRARPNDKPCPTFSVQI